MPLRKPCLGCGAVSYGSRCPDCQRAEGRRRQQIKPTAQGRSSHEQRRRARAVREWRRQHGDWCPGWGRTQPHPSADLTADHVTSVAASGEQDGPLQVLCLRCNSAKGAR